MSTCCNQPIAMTVNGDDLCQRHGRDALLAVAVERLDATLDQKVSDQKHRSAFMRHGAIAPLPQPKGASRLSGTPRLARSAF